MITSAKAPTPEEVVGYAIAAAAWGVHLVIFPPFLAMAFATRATFGDALVQLHDEAERIEARAGKVAA